MATNLSKKFALLCCSMMTMQALRLVISTAGFCVVRFHIDCELFNIFISRLVNAVLMSQLFGNWLGDIIVFGADGPWKLYGLATANWVEFVCFCSALFCICHTEVGHLTGFYWSMVCAYFWWKVSEAPATSIAAESADYFFAGFTLSGVWASCLKGLVMRCVSGGGKTKSFHSEPLGEVNVTVVGDVSVVGRRSVKTTVDHRAAKWLYIITIVLTFLMCLAWTVIAAVVEPDSSGGKKGVINDKAKRTGVGVVTGIAFGGLLAVPGGMMGAGVGWLFGTCCCLGQKLCQLIFGIVGALGGMAAGVAPVVKNAAEETPEGEWVGEDKWGNVGQDWAEGKGMPAPGTGLGAGAALGATIGLCIGACKDSKKSGFFGGALVGSALGLWSGEVANGAVSWAKAVTTDLGKQANNQTAANNWQQKVAVVVLGFMINVLGLGTVYSIYPGMAPCSITQFKYFNIIDILILILSSIAPIVIMGVDLGELDWKLAKAMGGKSAFATADDATARWLWMTVGLVLLVATNICEIIVLDIMQHPFSRMAQKVTNSGGWAVFLTVTMVTSQLVSTGVGFAATAAGSGFNDGIINMNSTAVLWTTECCGVLGEGYLTELKKYEPGKWPTQGMGKWATYKWWNNKAFGNAWQIWCCIGTTDLRRDIMLCRQ